MLPEQFMMKLVKEKHLQRSDYGTDMDGNYSLGMFGSSYQERLDDFIDRLNPNEEEGDLKKQRNQELSNVVA